MSFPLYFADCIFSFAIRKWVFLFTPSFLLWKTGPGLVGPLHLKPQREIPGCFRLSSLFAFPIDTPPVAVFLWWKSSEGKNKWNETKWTNKLPAL